MIPPRNPYRAILMRDYPEPLVALLAFILGIWLWDHYFGKPAGYAPGTEDVALVKIDRDLRLADAMARDPAWLRQLAGVGEPADTREESLAALRELAAGHALSLRGLEAYVVIRAIHDGKPADEAIAELPQGQPASDFTQSSRELANHRGTWWQAHLVEAWENSISPEVPWHQKFGEDGQQLRARTIFTRASIWLLGLAGLAFVPRTLRDLHGGLRAGSRGYGGAWPLPLGLVVFLTATLAWIGFTMSLEIGLGSLPGLHPALAIFLDSAARLLPSLIALGLLFRRPSHAVRVLGLNRPFRAGTILGMFSLLMLLDQGLRVLFADDAAASPGGGLNAGEAGLWGLSFAIASACLLAPLAEELLYRGVLFRSCWNRLGVLPAAMISSAVFAALHFYDGYGLASVWVFGLSAALLYAATGSLGACIALHFIYNSSIKIPEWIVYHGPLG